MRTPETTRTKRLAKNRAPGTGDQKPARDPPIGGLLTYLRIRARNGFTDPRDKRGEVSSTLLQGQAQRSGSICRVPAIYIEGLVTRSVREHLKPSEPIDDRGLVADYVKRVEERLIVQLAQIEKSGRRRAQGADTLDVPWRKTAVTRRREMLLPISDPPHQARPIRSETRATLIASIAQGRRWLNELVANANANVESIAKREKCSVRQVNMTISLAFLAPDLVKAAIEGRLPHGIGVTRLRDAPVEWSRQTAMLGLIG